LLHNQFMRRSAMALLPLVLLAAAGCGSLNQQRSGQAVPVKATQVIQRDTTITQSYAGQVQAKSEVKLQARVSGNLVAKFVNGGDTVKKGQPLFQLDRRQYENAVLASRAQLAQSQATYNNSQLDVQRYEKLAAVDGIAQQTLSTQRANAEQTAAIVEYNQANVAKANDDLNDTLIVSPVDGRIDVNDLSLGSYVQGGSTVLATVSSVDPIFVQFSMSENEYLNLSQKTPGNVAQAWGQQLKLVLSNGATYPLTGTLAQVDRGLAQNTGTLTMKAVFDNPQRLLIPGMFARIEVASDTRPGALLVPQRAVQQVLDKTFVTVVGEGDKAESRAVKLGAKIGSLWLVEEGLAPSDRVVVEGLTKLQPGAQLQVVMVGPDDTPSSPNQ